MDIKILDSHLREFLQTKATPEQIAKNLSLTSVGIERIEKIQNDYIYDIEVTTNRTDLASVVGLAREAGTVLPVAGIDATFTKPFIEKPQLPKTSVELSIINDDHLIHRICAVVMDITMGESPEYIKKRLEAAGIRSLNNVIDVTNYVMRTIGHPTHVFDYDRIKQHSITIRESKKGETVTTLDNKTYTLPGGDIVAVDGSKEIIDLIGIMGLKNSVVTGETKRIIFFVNNNNTKKLRQTSMTLGVRTEAAQLNEKNIDPELAMDALLYGISLFQKNAEGKVVSKIYDIYPHKPQEKTITVTEDHINSLIGVPLSLQKSATILTNLGFKTNNKGTSIIAKVPSFRAADMDIPEDLIEEIARVYGYHNLPNVLPYFESQNPVQIEQNEFYWETKVKHLFKAWGYTEVFTQSIVAEKLYEGPLEDAVTLQNPLQSDTAYMRRTIVPSLLEVVAQNPLYPSLQLFEVANVYHKRKSDLPKEIRMIAGILKKPKASFFEIKGLLEQLFLELGITNATYTELEEGSGADVHVGKETIGQIEILDDNLIDFELNFEKIVHHANLKRTFKKVSKFPPIFEDISLIISENTKVGEVMSLIKNQSSLISDVSLLDTYKDVRTFHIIYQSFEKNLTNEDIKPLREKIEKNLKEKLNLSVKE